jgi:mannose-1-phosphate guanylyltransferase / mannose-6-phosphate isomerase
VTNSATNKSEASPVITPVVLCGGSGTRLWPLSRKSFPKQFVPLVNGKSLFELTIARLSHLSNQLICVTAEEHRFLVSEAAPQAQIILEAQPRNTAPAMAIAALVSGAAPSSTAAQGAQGHGSQNALLLFCPADHHIPDHAAFENAVRAAAPAAAAGAVVTFGITPSYPATGYGYIETLQGAGNAIHQVARFIEKPNQQAAQQLILQGNVFWNAGIFMASASTLLAALRAHAPDILQSCEQASATSTRDGSFIRPDSKAFAACRSQSIDYAVMEPLSKQQGGIALAPLACAWSDVGSWNAVAELLPHDSNGNRVHGNGFTVNAQNTFIHAPHRPVVALGTQDLLIVDTPDAVMVAHKNNAEEVKEVVALLEKKNLAQAGSHRRVARPWGWFDSIDSGERFQVKRIGVKPGASISLQKHHHRAEHWIVVKGTAEVICGEKTITLTENQSTYIPLGEVHRLSNPGKTWLEIIEVQSGSYLGEDDIVRLEDNYGRSSNEKA